MASTARGSYEQSYAEHFAKLITLFYNDLKATTIQLNFKWLLLPFLKLQSFHFKIKDTVYFSHPLYIGTTMTDTEGLDQLV